MQHLVDGDYVSHATRLSHVYSEWLFNKKGLSSSALRLQSPHEMRGHDDDNGLDGRVGNEFLKIGVVRAPVGGGELLAIFTITTTERY
jgi:hypothetical protein